MKFESEYFKTGFSEKVFFGYMKLLLIGPFTALVCTATYFSIISDEKLDGKLGIIYSIRHITIEFWLITLFMGVVFSFLFIILLPRTHYSKRIILFLDFDDKARTIETGARYIYHSNIIKKTVSYDELIVSNIEKEYDGMTSSTYAVIQLSARHELIGWLFRSHFTWDDRTFASMEEKLMDIINSSTPMSILPLH